MKMESLAHASIDQLTVVDLRLEACRVPARHRFEMRPAPVERFIYILRGEVSFSLDGSVLQAGDRDMVYLPRDTAYRSLWHREAEFTVVDLLLRDGEGRDIPFGETPSVLFRDSHRVYDGLLSELAQKAEASGPFDWLERLSLCLKFLCELARDTNRRELDEKGSRIQKALAYLESNYCSDFPVDALARLCSLSPASFRRPFISCKGISPVEYRNRLRIHKAAQLLRFGTVTVSEAAEQVGMHDIKYFSKLCKRYLGMAPSALRKGLRP